MSIVRQEWATKLLSQIYEILRFFNIFFIFVKKNPPTFPNFQKLGIYRVAQKNVPNFAQVFLRSLSSYEGDILQVY